MSIVSSACSLNASCIPTIAFSLILYKLLILWLSWASASSVHLPSSAKPAITKCLICWNWGLQLTKNISRVIPFESIYCPVIPLLQSAKKIQLTLVCICTLSINPSELNRSIMPFSISMLILFLLNAKWTSARVENCFTWISPLTSMHIFITMSMTPLEMSSLKRDSW